MSGQGLLPYLLILPYCLFLTSVCAQVTLLVGLGSRLFLQPRALWSRLYQFQDCFLRIHNGNFWSFLPPSHPQHEPQESRMFFVLLTFVGLKAWKKQPGSSLCLLVTCELPELVELECDVNQENLFGFLGLGGRGGFLVPWKP